MPRTKKVADAAEKETKNTKKAVKAVEEVKAAAETVAEKVEENVAAVVEEVEEKKAAKKAAPKKAAPKKTAPAAPETKVDFFVEFGGVQVAAKEVVNNVKATIGKDAKEIAVYLKPEESKAYFVADGESGSMDVYFC